MYYILINICTNLNKMLIQTHQLPSLPDLDTTNIFLDYLATHIGW